MTQPESGYEVAPCLIFGLGAQISSKMTAMKFNTVFKLKYRKK